MKLTGINLSQKRRLILREMISKRVVYLKGADVKAGNRCTLVIVDDTHGDTRGGTTNGNEAIFSTG